MNTNNTKTIENLKIVLHNALAPTAAAPIVILIGSTQRKFLINWTNNARVNNQWFNCISFIFLLYFSKYKQKKTSREIIKRNNKLAFYLSIFHLCKFREYFKVLVAQQTKKERTLIRDKFAKIM